MESPNGLWGQSQTDLLMGLSIGSFNIPPQHNILATSFGFPNPKKQISKL